MTICAKCAEEAAKVCRELRDRFISEARAAEREGKMLLGHRQIVAELCAAIIEERAIAQDPAPQQVSSSIGTSTCDQAEPAAVAGLPPEPLLASHRRDIEQGIKDAYHPRGMSTHSGKGSFQAHHIERLLKGYDALRADAERLQGQLAEMTTKYVQPCCQQFDTCEYQCTPLVKHLRAELTAERARKPAPQIAKSELSQEQMTSMSHELPPLEEVRALLWERDHILKESAELVAERALCTSKWNEVVKEREQTERLRNELIAAQAELAAGRERAIEECAMACENLESLPQLNMDSDDGRMYDAYALALSQAAKAIRVLKEPPEPAPQQQSAEIPKCGLCGEPMPPGEEMFKYHGYSGDCPKPPLPRPPSLSEQLAAAQAELEAAIKRLQVEPTEIHILFDGPPSHKSGRFVEVENAAGQSLSVGRWEQHGNYWHLIFNTVLQEPAPQQVSSSIGSSAAERETEPR